MGLRFQMSICAVFQIGSLGDTIVSIPALLSIKSLLPDCSEYLLVNRFESSLRILPNQVFDMVWKPTHQLSYVGSGSKIRQSCSAAPLLAKLRYYRPRYGVYLMPVDRSQRKIDRDKLFFQAGGVRELVGFRTFTDFELQAGSAPTLSDTQAYLRFRRLWNEASDEKYPSFSAVPLLKPGAEARERVKTWLQSTRRYPDRRLVAFSPYSNSSSKNLSQEVISELLLRLETSLGVEIVLLGGKKDFTPAAAAIAAAQAGRNACGAFPLEESAALLQTCDMALCVDSGPMHLAGALGVPLVAAFSRMNDQLGRWFPLGGRHTILYREVECAGCRLSECNVAGHPCMRNISVDQIVRAVSARLNGLPILLSDMDDTKVFSC
jgi:ADP-heptose:LPS heptosyltransferase